MKPMLLIRRWRARTSFAIALIGVGCGDASNATETSGDGPTTGPTDSTASTDPTPGTDASASGDPTTASSATSATTPSDTTVGDPETSGPSGETNGETDSEGNSESADESTGGTSTPPGPSPGCGVSDLQPGSYFAIEVEVGGFQRTFDLVVPAEHDGETPLPLVVAFHGWTLNSQIMANMSDMSATAAERGFIVAYPQGFDDSWNAGSCCGGAFDQNVDDVAFARALVEGVGNEACIDERRVFAAGFSNGGFLSHRLGCEASDVFAAIGPVAGVIMVPDAECTPPRAVPVMHLHGTADTSVVWRGNGLVPHISVPGSIAGWVDRNGCDPDPTVTFQDGDTTCETWSSCGDDGAEVVLCTIEGMGHCWPGDPVCTGLMETPSLTVQASDVLADFFDAHPMP